MYINDQNKKIKSYSFTDMLPVFANMTIKIQ